MIACAMFCLLSAPQEGGWDLFRQGKYEEAKKALEKDLKLAPQSAALVDGVAWCDFYLGNYDAAEKGFTEALKIDPKYDYSRQGLEAVAAVRRAPLDEAAALLSAGNYEEARALYQRVARGKTVTPESRLHEALAGDGWCLYYLRDYAEAMKLFREAIKKRKGYPDAYRGIAYSWYMRADPTEALVSLQLSFKEEPKDYYARLTAGSCHALKENYKEALKEYETAAGCTDGPYGAYVGQGWCNEKLGNAAAALEAFGKAIDISPYALDADLRHLAETRESWWGLLTRAGWSALRQSLHTWARQEFEAALLLNPEDGEARGGLAFVSFHLGDYTGALDAIDKAGPASKAYAFPTTPADGTIAQVECDLKALKGWALLRLGRFDEALAAFDAVLAAHPKWIDAACGRGWTLYSQGNYLEAEKAFAAAENLMDGYSDALAGSSAVRTWRYADYTEAWWLIYAGSCDEAVRALQRILRATDRRFPSSRNDIVEASIGWAYYYAGKHDEAIASFDRALKLNEKQGLAHKGKGFARLAQEQPAKAVESLREALKDEAYAKDVETICALGLALRLTKDYAGAEKNYREALAVEPRSATAMAGLGWLFLDMNRPADARDAFAQAIQQYPTAVDSAAFREKIARGDELAPLYAALGWAYYALGSYEQAEKDFRTASEKVPKEKESQRGLGLALLGQGKLADADRILSRYFQDAPRSESGWGVLSSTLNLWGWAQYNAKSYTDAVRIFERLVALHERDPLQYADPFDGLGWCFLRKDDIARARKEFLKAIAVSPRHESSLRGLEIVQAMEE